MAAAVNDYGAAQSSRFGVHRPIRLGAEIQMHSRSGEEDAAHTQLCIGMVQFRQRRFGVMHRQ